MQDVLRAPDIVVKVHTESMFFHLGGHLIAKCFEHDTAAFCFVQLIETLSHPSMFKREPTLASYLDLVITLAVQFCSFCTCSLSFRGTQREYSSKPLKHSIVKRT